MEKKVSVIIPVYNTAPYLTQCLDSIINQSLKQLEIIIVDDGSSDDSWEIISTYAKKYPDKIQAFHKENGGQATARNLALRYAKGEYLGFVDSDDWIDVEMYEKMYDKAKSENLDIVICDMVDHYPDREIYHHSSSFDDKFSVTPSACNKIFKRDFCEGITFPEGLWYEDFCYTTKQLMKTEKIGKIHKGFYHCHCREISTMCNNNALKNKDILVVLEELERYVKENNFFEKYKNALEYMYIEHILITTINRLEKQKNYEKREVITYLRKEVVKKYPQFYKGEVFKRFPKNRQVIALLNAKGLSAVSRFIFEIKAKL